MVTISNAQPGEGGVCVCVCVKIRGVKHADSFIAGQTHEMGIGIWLEIFRNAKAKLLICSC